MDKSVDNNINQLHPSKILEEMGIAWNDTVEKRPLSYIKKSQVSYQILNGPILHHI